MSAEPFVTAGNVLAKSDARGPDPLRAALVLCEERLTAWQAGGSLQVEATLNAIAAARAALQGVPVAASNAREAALRPVVEWFADRMEVQLRANDHKTGWLGHTFDSLRKRLDEEAYELRGAVKDNKGAAEIVREAADVANFAMMIADNARRAALRAPEQGAAP
jgi:NTP pyrophosphatase (non-canonical NTP hydrolase)